MKRIVICARGAKALAFIEAFISEPSAGFPVFVYVDVEDNVSHDYSSAIINQCKQHHINCELLKKTPKFTLEDLVISVGWRFLLEAPNLWVIHDSLLPRYRGFNPLVTAMLNGDNELGITLLRGVTEVDAGPILLQERIKIQYPLTLNEAFKKLFPLYANIARKIAKHLLGQINFDEQIQDESQVSFSTWRDEQDYQIDWNDSATKIRRFIDAVGFPYAGASTLLNQQLIRINTAIEIKDVVISNRTAGKVFAIENGKPIVACGSGLLKIETAACDGKSILPFTKLKSRFN